MDSSIAVDGQLRPSTVETTNLYTITKRIEMGTSLPFEQKKISIIIHYKQISINIPSFRAGRIVVGAGGGGSGE